MADHLNAVDRIGIDRVRRRELGDDARPVGVHLVGQDHRQRRVDALPELQAVDLNDDGSVRPDVDERVWRIDLRRRRRGRFLRERGTVEIEGNQ